MDAEVWSDGDWTTTRATPELDDEFMVMAFETERCRILLDVDRVDEISIRERPGVPRLGPACRDNSDATAQKPPTISERPDTRNNPRPEPASDLSAQH